MNVDMLEALNSAVREGTFQRAADRMSLNPSAVNLEICALENELGFALLKKGKNIRRVILTTRGEYFYALLPELMQILRKIEKIRHQCGA